MADLVTQHINRFQSGFASRCKRQHFCVLLFGVKIVNMSFIYFVEVFSPHCIQGGGGYHKPDEQKIDGNLGYNKG